MISLILPITTIYELWDVCSLLTQQYDLLPTSLLSSKIAFSLSTLFSDRWCICPVSTHTLGLILESVLFSSDLLSEMKRNGKFCLLHADIHFFLFFFCPSINIIVALWYGFLARNFTWRLWRKKQILFIQLLRLHFTALKKNHNNSNAQRWETKYALRACFIDSLIGFGNGWNVIQLIENNKFSCSFVPSLHLTLFIDGSLT